MKEKQIIFIGGRFEAALNSFNKLKNEKTEEVVGFYTKISKNNWEKLKNEIKKQGIKKIKGEEIDYSDLEKIMKKINEQTIDEKRKIIINVTGASKEVFLAIIAILSIRKRKEIRDVELVMVQVNDNIIRFPPHLFISIEKINNGKKKTTKKIMKELYKNNGSAYMKDIVKKVGKSKSNISDILKTMEDEKLIKRVRKGRDLKIILNEFAYKILKTYWRDKNE